MPHVDWWSTEWKWVWRFRVPCSIKPAKQLYLLRWQALYGEPLHSRLQAFSILIAFLFFAFVWCRSLHNTWGLSIAAWGLEQPLHLSIFLASSLNWKDSSRLLNKVSIILITVYATLRLYFNISACTWTLLDGFFPAVFFRNKTPQDLVRVSQLQVYIHTTYMLHTATPLVEPVSFFHKLLRVPVSRHFPN